MFAYLDGVERIQSFVSLKGPLLPLVEYYNYAEELVQGVTPLMPEVDRGEPEEGLDDDV